MFVEPLDDAIYQILEPYAYRFLPLQSKKGDKDEESIQSSTTPDPGYQ